MSIAACAELLSRADPERFRAVMAAPVAARPVLLAVQAFNVEIARAPWVTHEAMIAEMRLQWWRDALSEIQQGKPARGHDVVNPLATLLDAESAALLDGAVVARRWDIYAEPFEDAAHFEEYIGRTTADLMLASARRLGPCDAEVVRAFGYASGLAHFLRAVAALRAAGRKPLIEDSPDAIAALATEGMSRLERARRRIDAVSKPARAALLSGWQAEALLRQAIRAPERVLQGSLEMSGAAQRLRLIRAALTLRI